MKTVALVREFFWPRLEKCSGVQLEAQGKRREDSLKSIDMLSFHRDTEVALAEARRFSDAEVERRRGTDQKAATYLPLVTALIPLILGVVVAFWDNKVGSAPVWVNGLLLSLAVAYTAAAGIWAFRVLEVSVSHEVGLGDFEQAWKKPKPSQAFARRTLAYTLLNGDRINQKVTCLKMAHAFLLRAFLTFSLLLLTNIAWFFGSLIYQNRSTIASLFSRVATAIF